MRPTFPGAVTFFLGTPRGQLDPHLRAQELTEKTGLKSWRGVEIFPIRLRFLKMCTIMHILVHPSTALSDGPGETTRSASFLWAPEKSNACPDGPWKWIFAEENKITKYVILHFEITYFVISKLKITYFVISKFKITYFVILFFSANTHFQGPSGHAFESSGAD